MYQITEVVISQLWEDITHNDTIGKAVKSWEHDENRNRANVGKGLQFRSFRGGGTKWLDDRL